jgi:hypothetical protein
MSETARMILFFLAIALALTYYLIGYAKLLQKAGRPGWIAIIPIYSDINLLQICGLSPWLIIIELIPLVNIFFIMYLMYRLSIVFSKGSGFTIGLMAMPLIFMPILGYGSSQYTPPITEEPLPPENHDTNVTVS